MGPLRSIAAFLVIIASTSTLVSESLASEWFEDMAKTHARIAGIQIAAPLGHFLLIRKGIDKCAVKFTMIKRLNSDNAISIFKSSDPNDYAEYDWFYVSDEKNNLGGNGVKKGHERLNRRPLYGMGRLAFQFGDTDVKCGPFVRRWDYPTLIFINRKNYCDDLEVEMAPTKWDDSKQINVNDYSIRWYKCDEKRKEMLIPLSDL